MMTGAQIVHMYYDPMRDLPLYVEAERQRRKQLQVHCDEKTAATIEQTDSPIN